MKQQAVTYEHRPLIDDFYGGIGFEMEWKLRVGM